MRETARYITVLAAFFFGGLFAIGSLIAVMLEGDGFTSAARDGPRAGYVALLALGLLASIAIPFGIAAWLFPQSRTASAGGGLAITVAAAVLFVLALR